LKAALIANGQPFPKVHDLLALSTLCDQAGILTGLDPARLDLLSAYAVRVRYPGEDPDAAEARSALEIARSVRRFVRGFLGLAR
jgi:HEPN domain-containing protein